VAAAHSTIAAVLTVANSTVAALVWQQQTAQSWSSCDYATAFAAFNGPQSRHSGALVPLPPLVVAEGVVVGATRTNAARFALLPLARAALPARSSTTCGPTQSPRGRVHPWVATRSGHHHNTPPYYTPLRCSGAASGASPYTAFAPMPLPRAPPQQPQPTLWTGEWN
jgi:hypothetical protein